VANPFDFNHKVYFFVQKKLGLKISFDTREFILIKWTISNLNEVLNPEIYLKATFAKGK
jgi:hypothetical protein